MSLYAENLNYGISINGDAAELESGRGARLTKVPPLKQRSHFLQQAPEGPTFNNYACGVDETAPEGLTLTAPTEWF